MKRTRRTEATRRTGRGGGAENRARVRFALVGAGHIAQNAVLPAFGHAKKWCELTAIVSGDAKKRRELGRMYGVRHLFAYEDFDAACRAGVFDAVYIALPNDMHREYAERAAAAGIHILCEKPMAATEADCAAMIRAAKNGRVRLMVAYRLHFEEANMKAVEIVRGGKLGEPRLFDSVFSMQVKGRNIRVEAERGGGPLYDIGIYCINAARYIFADEPTHVTAVAVRGRDPRFAEVEEAASVILSFTRERIATFTCSFGAADVSSYRVVGTKGSLIVEPAYDYSEELGHCLTVGEKTTERVFKKRDQFAPELIYFARCVREGTDPEPGGAEGMADVRIIEAIRESAQTGRTVKVERAYEDGRPGPELVITVPPARKRRLVHAEAAHRD